MRLRAELLAIWRLLTGASSDRSGASGGIPSLPPGVARPDGRISSTGEVPATATRPAHQAFTITVGPVELSMKHRRQAELAQLGFIGLLNERRAGDRALIIFDTPSVAKPRSSADQDVTGDQRAAFQLPFVMVISRFMHYAKLIERDASLAGEDGMQIEARLNRWLVRYAADEDAPMEVRAASPLRAGWAKVTAQGDGGMDIVQVFLQPRLGDGEVAPPARFQFPRTGPIGSPAVLRGGPSA